MDEAVPLGSIRFTSGLVSPPLYQGLLELPGWGGPSFSLSQLSIVPLSSQGSAIEHSLGNRKLLAFPECEPS